MKKTVYILSFLITQVLWSQMATVPFVEDGLIFIKVQVNDYAQPLNFVFDTGASAAVLDATVAKRIGVQASFSQNAQGAAGSQTYEVATGQKLLIDKITLDGLNVVLVDLGALSRRSGNTIDGIIGYDILNRFVTQFDFKSKDLKLYKSIDDVTSLSGYKKVPMKLGRGSIPEVRMNINFHDGSTKNGTFLFDSGANMTVLFNTPYAKKEKLEEKIGKTIIGTARGLTTSSTHITGSAKSVSFGEYNFKDVVVQLSEAKAGVSASRNFSGILGAKIINRFDMVLDYENEDFFFKPNDCYDKAFEFPLSGFAIAYNENGKIVITQLVLRSEAAMAGIEEGDELLAINGISSSTLQTYRDLLKKEGELITLKVRKPSGKTEEKKIVLKRLI